MLSAESLLSRHSLDDGDDEDEFAAIENFLSDDFLVRLTASSDLRSRADLSLRVQLEQTGHLELKTITSIELRVDTSEMSMGDLGCPLPHAASDLAHESYGDAGTRLPNLLELKLNNSVISSLRHGLPVVQCGSDAI
jgi:hypothetical protein